jgi:hypothetical protein
MAVVKGSKQTSLRVISHDAKQRFRQRLLLILLCVSLAAASFFAGQFSAWQNQQEVNAQRDQLLEDIVQANAEVTRMSQRMAILEKGGEVDRTATENVRQTVINLRSQVVALEEEITFYKGIMAPSSNKRGLAIQKLELNQSPTGGYQYKVVLTQVKDNRAQIKGLLALNFIGLKAGKEVILPLKDVSDQVNDLGTKFRFKYFQDIQGTFMFPKGFKPLKVQIVVQSSGKNSTRIEETFDWSVQKSS